MAVNDTAAKTEINLTLAPADQLKSRTTVDNIEFSVTTGAEKFVHDTEIPIEVKVKWNKTGWNTALTGEALVYNSNEQVVLFGAASGYNGKVSDENFINMNFTYDVATKRCIANVTYDITSEKNKTAEFGQNSELFADAYKYLEGKMLEEQKTQAEEEKPVSIEPFAVDTSLKQIFSSGDSKAKMTMYVPKNLISGGGSGPVSAKMYGSSSVASTYIINNVNSTAWAVVASNCDVSFSANQGLRYISGTHHPTNSETNYEISIPLPLS